MIVDLLKELSFSTVGKIIPIARKWIYPPDSLIKDIEIIPRHDNPISVTLNSQSVPYIVLYFTVINKSQYLDIDIQEGNFKLSTDSQYVEIFQEEPFIKECKVSKKKTYQLVIKKTLNSNQSKHFEQLKDHKNVTVSVALFLRIHSKYYTSKKEVNLHTIKTVIN